MKWQITLLLAIVGLFPFLTIPQALADVTVPASAYFGLPTYSTYIKFSSSHVFSSVYRSGDYWYFNGYGFQVQDANLTILTFFSEDLLVFIVNATSGTSTSKIYLQDLGSPTTVVGATTWSYNAVSKLLTVTINHSDIVQVTASWTDTTPPTYSNTGHNTTTAGATCKFSAKFTDLSGLSGYIFTTDNTGAWVNDTWVSFVGNPAWANVTKTLSVTVGQIVHYRWYANDTNDNWVTADGWFSLTTTATGYPFNSDVGYNVTRVAFPILFSVKWQDAVGLSGYKFEWNGTGTLTNTTWVAFSTNPGWANVSKTLPATNGVKVYFRWFANDSDNQWSATTQYSLTTTYYIFATSAINDYNNYLRERGLPYILAENGVVSALYFGDDTLTWTVIMPKGNTSQTNVACQSRGGPASVVGESDFVFNSVNQTLYVYAVHASPVVLSVQWQNVDVFGASTSSLIQYLLAWDVFGFVLAMYVSKIGVAFYGILGLILFGVFYNRTKSLAFISVMWILIAGYFVSVTMEFTPVAIVMVILGLVGIIYSLFEKETS